MMREGLMSLRLQIFPDMDCLSDTVSVANIDPKLDSDFRIQLAEKYEILIAGGLGKSRARSHL
jgi:aspartate aminotransferase-like enzyme